VRGAFYYKLVCLLGNVLGIHKEAIRPKKKKKEKTLAISPKCPAMILAEWCRRSRCYEVGALVDGLSSLAAFNRSPRPLSLTASCANGPTQTQVKNQKKKTQRRAAHRDTRLVLLPNLPTPLVKLLRLALEIRLSLLRGCIRSKRRLEVAFKPSVEAGVVPCFQRGTLRRETLSHSAWRHVTIYFFPKTKSTKDGFGPRHW
jgi:hypothetical protein